MIKGNVIGLSRKKNGAIKKGKIILI